MLTVLPVPVPIIIIKKKKIKDIVNCPSLRWVLSFLVLEHRKLVATFMDVFYLRRWPKRLRYNNLLAFPTTSFPS